MRNIRMMAITAIAVTVAVSAWAADGVWYVDKDNESGVQDGLSWQTAFTTVQPAIDAAYLAGGGEVWVGEGVYDEERQPLIDPAAPKEESNIFDGGSLYMREGVDLYGGFVGDETSRDPRDPAAHETVLDGSTAFAGDNAWHVVYCPVSIAIDGLTIRGGDANLSGSGPRRQDGAGLLLWGADGAVVSRCLFTENKARGVGGGIYGQPGCIIEDCTFTNNWGGVGGGVLLCGAHVRRCTFIGNTGAGGAIATRYVMAAVPSGIEVNQGGTVSQCLFVGNQGRGAGGAIWISDGTQSHPAEMTIDNCVFWGNKTDSIWAEGGAIYVRGGDPCDFCGTDTYVNIINCTFYGNDAGERGKGGALYCVPERYSHVYMWNSVLWNNMPEQQADEMTGVNVYENCLIQGIVSPEHAIFSDDPLFVDPDNGDFRLENGSPCIDSGTASLDEHTAEYGWPVPIAAPAKDIDGVPRPIGAGFDLGAYEYLEPDADGDGVTNAVDVQLVINAALGVAPPGTDADVSGDGKVDAVDVQIVINAALGLYG
jgi:predicted outer membrane repeat protein